MTLPLWIRTADELAALAAELVGTPALAIDTEADSLHHYPGKLCLVQVADARGRGHLVDPLVLRDLSPLGAALADPGTIKVLHAADNDLAYLKRLYGVTVNSLFDTAVAARFLGATSLGLEGLLTQYLGVTAVKSRQKDDWSRRPLSDAQEAYALDDVLHLIPLRQRLLEELRAIGREQWVEEECEALASMPATTRVFDPEDYLSVKGARTLDRRGLATLRELYVAREAWARSSGRPIGFHGPATNDRGHRHSPDRFRSAPRAVQARRGDRTRLPPAPDHIRRGPHRYRPCRPTASRPHR